MINWIIAAFCLGFAFRSAWPAIVSFYRATWPDERPIWMRYKPTGKVLYLPAHYESEAIDQLLRDFDEIPQGVALNSPDFEILYAPPAPAAPATV